MNLLIDSAALVWFLEGDSHLTDAAARIIEDSKSRSLVSAVTTWELAVKAGLGKIRLPYELGEDFDLTIARNGFELIPLSHSALERTARLPDHHRDPFDRLLAAEALEHSATMVSNNQVFDAYGVKRIW